MVKKSTILTLLIGDLITLLVVTIIGIGSHENTISIYRVGVNFLPLTIAWLIVAPWFGAYDQNIIPYFKRIPQLLLAVLVAAPLAALLRGFILNTMVQPIFVVVLGLTNALGIGIWRGLWIIFSKRKK